MLAAGVAAAGAGAPKRPVPVPVPIPVLLLAPAANPKALAAEGCAATLRYHEARDDFNVLKASRLRMRYDAATEVSFTCLSYQRSIVVSRFIHKQEY